MSYGRIDINLLPSELSPGPAIRYSLLFSILILALLIAFIVIDSITGMTRLASAREENLALKQRLDDGQQIVRDHALLVNIRDSINNYGRLITLASADYIDMPVVLERLSKLVPDEVYLERVTNDRSTGASATTNLVIRLKTSRRDPELLLSTLNSFKKDPLFANCFMPVAEFEEVSLTDVMTRNSLTWTAQGPDLSTNLVAPQYAFEIQATVPRLLGTDGLPVVTDESEYYTGFDMQLSPEAAASIGGKAAGSKPKPEETTGTPAGPGGSSPAAPPAGVDVKGVN